MQRAAESPLVLIVDDDPVFLEITAAIFSKAGLTVAEASSGAEAVMRMRQEGGRIDWLLTDIRLDDILDGWSVADEFHLSHPARPIIYVSAGPSNPRRSLPGSLFVRKPIKPERLAEIARMIRAGTLQIASAAA